MVLFESLLRRLGYIKMSSHGLTLSPAGEVMALQPEPGEPWASQSGRRLPLPAPSALGTPSPESVEEEILELDSADFAGLDVASPPPPPTPIDRASDPAIDDDDEPGSDEWEWQLALARARAAAEGDVVAAPPAVVGELPRPIATPPPPPPARPTPVATTVAAEQPMSTPSATPDIDDLDATERTPRIDLEALSEPEPEPLPAPPPPPHTRIDRRPGLDRWIQTAAHTQMRRLGSSPPVVRRSISGMPRVMRVRAPEPTFDGEDTRVDAQPAPVVHARTSGTFGRQIGVRR